MIDKIASILSNRDFRYAKSNIPYVFLFFRTLPEDILDCCILLDNTKGTPITTENAETLCNTIERTFLLQGAKKVNFFFLVLSDYIERDKSFLEFCHPVWILDALEKRVLIYDDQPNDYYNTKKEIENVLTFKPKPAIVQNFKMLPFATIALVIINIILYFYTTSNADGNISYFIYKHGGAYWRLIYEEGEYYRLFTCMFLHFSSEHLANNMLILAVMGRETEKILGHLRFACIYLLSGLGASLMSSLYYMNNNADELILSAGASGAIYGILGALIISTLMYPQCRKQIHPGSVILITLLSLNNGFFNDNVDNIAHIGGLLFGIIITFISCLCRKNIIK